MENLTFNLPDFNGPIDLLLHLIQKNELDIYEIPINSLVEQFATYLTNNEETELEDGAEFIGNAAHLMWQKSRNLLPRHEQAAQVQEEEPLDPKFEIIHQLIDYCRFKQAAKALSTLEDQQSGHYLRGGVQETELRKPLGIEHISLEDLSSLFKDVLAKAASNKGTIEDENWKVSDKIKAIRSALRLTPHIPFNELFSTERSKMELIVTFLAILELMKLGEVIVARDTTTQQISVYAERNQSN